MPGPLAIASVALPLLQKLGESRDVRRYKQQLEQQQKTANLINALSKGRIQYQPTAEYQPSAFTRLTGAASTGLGAYNTFQNLQAAQAAEKLAQEKGALEVGQLQRKASLQRGAADYAGDIAQQAAGIRAAGPGGAGPQLGQFPTFGGQIEPSGIRFGPPPGGAVAAPSLLEQMGRLDPFRVMGRQQVAREASAQAAADRVAEATEARELARQQKADRVAEATEAYTAMTDRLKVTGEVSKSLFDRYKDIVTQGAEQGISYDDVTKELDLTKLPLQYHDSLKSLHEVGLYNRARGVNKEIADFLYKDVRQKLAGDQTLKKSGDLSFGMGLMVAGFNQQNGVGDVSMVNAAVRLSDPGVSVRPAEAKTMEEAMALAEQFGLVISGEKLLYGDRFTPAMRNRLLQQGLAIFGNSRTLNNLKLSDEAALMLPHIMNIAGQEDVSAIVEPFLKTYRLRPIEDYMPGGMLGYKEEFWNAGQAWTAPAEDTDSINWEKTMGLFE